jgi:hypothetical protein
MVGIGVGVQVGVKIGVCVGVDGCFVGVEVGMGASGGSVDFGATACVGSGVGVDVDSSVGVAVGMGVTVDVGVATCESVSGGDVGTSVGRQATSRIRMANRSKVMSCLFTLMLL